MADNQVKVTKNNPTMGDVHVNGVLTNFSVAYLQQPSAFIADRVFQEVPVSKRSDLYPIWTRKGTNIVAMQKRAPGTKVVQIEQNVSTHPYYLDVYALGATIFDQDRDNADDWCDLELARTELLSRQALLLKEYMFARDYFATGKWGIDYTGVEGTPSTHQFRYWDDDISTPKQDIETAKLEMLEATGYKPNAMVLGIEAWNKLQNNPSIIDLLKYGGQVSGNLAVVTLEMITALFGLKEILISEAIYDSATANPVTETNGFVLGKHGLLFYKPERPSLYSPAAGYTLYWNKSNYRGSVNGFRMKKYRDETIESDVLELQGAFTQEQVCSDMGIFLSGLVQ